MTDHRETSGEGLYPVDDLIQPSPNVCERLASRWPSLVPPVRQTGNIGQFGSHNGVILPLPFTKRPLSERRIQNNRRFHGDPHHLGGSECPLQIARQYEVESTALEASRQLGGLLHSDVVKLDVGMALSPAQEIPGSLSMTNEVNC